MRKCSFGISKNWVVKREFFFLLLIFLFTCQKSLFFYYFKISRLISMFFYFFLLNFPMFSMRNSVFLKFSNSNSSQLNLQLINFQESSKAQCFDPQFKLNFNFPPKEFTTFQETRLKLSNPHFSILQFSNFPNFLPSPHLTKNKNQRVK